MQLGVVGAGTMGNGIAQVFAAHGHDAVMVDIDEAAVQRGKAAVEKSLGRFVAKEKMTAEEMAAILDRLQISTSMADLAGCDLVVEAVLERLEVKQSVFGELDKIVKREGILASNTSSIWITEIAAATARPAQVIGMHFMNPVPLMKLGMAHPMGPLALADFIGLDVCLAILEVLHRDLGDDKYRPCPLLRKKVMAGHLGRKSGRGFYSYA